MKKSILIVLTLVIILSVVTGCNSKDNTELKLNEKITEVSISKSKGFGKMNSDFFKVFDSEEDVKVFESVLSNAIKQEGIVDMIKPEFDMKVVYDDNDIQKFHLWIGDKGQISTLMKIDDTNTIYNISKEMTNELIELIK